MKTFSVKNFERFQHYKDRAPPWIKLYNELLDDYKFGALPDASKMHLIAIWLLASRSENKIPYDPAWVGRRINANSKVDLDLLVRSGFIVVDQSLRIVEQDASTPLAKCLSREREEGETEESRDREEEIPASPVVTRLRKKAKGPIPDGFTVSESNLAYGKTLGFSDFELRREHQKYCHHAKANGRLLIDWDAGEHNWLTQASEYAGKRPRGSEDVSDDGQLEILDQIQLEAWDAYGIKQTGKPYPRNKKGGWRFPSKWPPGYENKMFEGVQKLVAVQP